MEQFPEIIRPKALGIRIGLNFVKNDFGMNEWNGFSKDLICFRKGNLFENTAWST